MQQYSLPARKRHRLKQTWIALSRKNELVHFFHNGLSIGPNVPSLGLPLCGSFKLCKLFASAYSACPVRWLDNDIVQKHSPSRIKQNRWGTLSHISNRVNLCGETQMRTTAGKAEPNNQINPWPRPGLQWFSSIASNLGIRQQ